MDAGWAAIIGAVIGGGIGLLGVYVVTKNEWKKWKHGEKIKLLGEREQELRSTLQLLDEECHGGLLPEFESTKLLQALRGGAANEFIKGQLDVSRLREDKEIQTEKIIYASSTGYFMTRLKLLEELDGIVVQKHLLLGKLQETERCPCGSGKKFRQCHGISSMKTIKFVPKLVPLILSGEKTTTWRLFDDKNLQVEDVVLFVNKLTGEEFAKARITAIREKRLGDITPEDEEGHEPFHDAQDRLETYRSYYGDQVTTDTMVKMLHYELL